ncbi:MAG: hypothetical protein DSY82_02450 [Flavobacteriia bacterium]|nr:MAG: hypothetical protein DSY82_02450 [Flavobacteriia bacterium]
MPKLIFSINIKKDKLFGYVFVPYFLSEKDKEFYTINKRITLSDIENQNFSFEEWMIKVINISHSLSYAELNKRFNKKNKKFSFDAFFNNTDKENVFFINSFIEKKKLDIVQILKKKEPLLFTVTDRNSNIHSENLIDISHETAKVKMIFEKKTDTLHYKIQVSHNDKPIDLQDGNIKIISNHSPSVIYKNSMFWFEKKEFNGNKLNPFLKKSEIIVPTKLESIFFEKFIKPSVRNFNCEVKGFKLHEITVKPKAELRIEKTIFGDFIFTPYFIYQTNKIVFYSKQRSFVEVIENNGNYALKSIQRNYTIESFYLDELESSGLIETDKHFKFVKKAIDKYEFSEQTRELLYRLQQKGFKIINYLFAKEVSYSNVSLSYQTSQKQDWFDLYIKVQFGDFEIDFLQLKDHILTKNYEYELPDGTIAIIPEVWFSELNSLAKRTNKNNQTSIRKTHLQILENNKTLKSDAEITKRINAFKVKEEVSLPKKSIAKLRDYQIKGYQWLYQLTQHQFGVCLADDMGLGKTLQVITLLQKYFEKHKISGEIQHSKLKSIPVTNFQYSLFDEGLSLNSDNKNNVNKSNESTFQSVLLVVPKSLIYNWIVELKKFAPELTYSVYHTSNRDGNLKNAIHQKNIIITTYGVVRMDIEQLKDYQFSYLVLDESQAIKNPNSKTYQAVTQLDSQYRISITGTPIENNLTDLWSQMNFLNPNILGDLSFFENAYKYKILNNTEAPELEELRSIINPFILRRLKKDVAKELPEKIEQTVYCEMHPDQLELYEKEKSAIRNELMSGNSKSNYIDVLAVLNRLRQIAIHPDLLDAKSEIPSGKFETIVQYMESIIDQGDKFLVFSSFVKHLNLFKQYFEDKDISYEMLTGKDNKRQQIVDRFEKTNSIKPFLISIKAGGIGLNLTSANYVFIIDPWWNPFVEKQAIDRTHRIGQDKNVIVYRFISKDSIEEKIQQLQKTKLEMSDSLIENDISEKINIKDLLQLI